MTNGAISMASCDAAVSATALEVQACGDRWRRPRVAFQGAPGAFSDEAIESMWGGNATAIPHADFGAVLRAVSDGDVEYALVPVENSSIGTIEESAVAMEWHERTRDDVVVLGHTMYSVQHCLLAREGATLDSVRRVASHPAALAQCATFAERHPHMTYVAAYDTAGAAAAIARNGDLSDAAIAPRGAAERYGLVILAEGIQDDPQNATRFAVVGRRGAILGGGESDVA